MIGSQSTAKYVAIGLDFAKDLLGNVMVPNISTHYLNDFSAQLTILVVCFAVFVLLLVERLQLS